MTKKNSEDFVFGVKFSSFQIHRNSTHSAALLDANILYSAPMHDLVIQLAVDGLFWARWTADIHSEWIEALLRHDPNRDRTALERTRDLMNEVAADALVEGYESLIPALKLPDPNDRHVLAAAIVGKCNFIVTQNLKDFPEDVLTPYGIEAQHPDNFLSQLLSLAPDQFCAAVRKVRARLKKPPYTAEQYLQTLEKIGLTTTVGQLKPMIDQLWQQHGADPAESAPPLPVAISAVRARAARRARNRTAARPSPPPTTTRAAGFRCPSRC
jgi:predicted nucleic acid-binding protein